MEGEEEDPEGVKKDLNEGQKTQKGKGDKRKERDTKTGEVKDAKRNGKSPVDNTMNPRLIYVWRKDERWAEWLDNKIALLINRGGIDVRDYGGKDYDEFVHISRVSAIVYLRFMIL